MYSKKYFRIFFAAASFSGIQAAIAQGARFDDVWVGAGAEMYIKYGNNVTFGENVKTDRAFASSVISFASVSGQLNIDGSVDGRVKVYGPGNAAYLPTANNGIASQVILLEATAPSAPITALYNATAPAGIASLGTGVAMLPGYEHWVVNGNNTARLRLSWDSNMGYQDDAIAAGYEADDFTISAWDGTRWIMIPSSATNESTLSDGSIVSDQVVNFNNYSAFTLGFKDGCVPVITANGVVTYNGTWSGAPDEYKTVIINQPLTVTPETSFRANELIMNEAITIEDGAYIEVLNGVTKPANGGQQIYMQSEGSFVQRSSTTAVPEIYLVKVTKPLKKWDYSYLSGPVQRTDLKSYVATNSTAIDPVTGGHHNQPYDSTAMFQYVSQAGADGSWQPFLYTAPGKGFIARIKNAPPFVDFNFLAKINIPYFGYANNGIVQVPLGSAATGNRSYNLLGNPYPSAIDAGEFLAANENLGGAIYYWTATLPNSAGATADYAVWNLAGSVVTLPVGSSLTPTGYIATGQAFMVKSLESNGVVHFDNCMRITGNNDTYFRTAPQQMDRYWLNLTNSAGIFSQILVNYTDQATYGYDRLYDAHRNSTSTAQLYSYIETAKYAINSRPEFELSDAVPLGVSRTDADSELLTIALHQPEGLFAEGDVTIYLHDMLLGIYHDFTNGSYTFSAGELQNNDRFEVVYQASGLGVENPVGTLAAQMSINDAKFRIQSSSTIQDVVIFDITGRQVQHYIIGENTYSAPFNHAQGVYIAKAKLTDGRIVTQKLINGK